MMRIGVVGLGTMGLGIAQVFAQAGHQVMASDAFKPARVNARDRLQTALQQRVDKGAMTTDARDAALGAFTVVETLADLRRADLVIEAVAEVLAVKQALFAALEAVVSTATVLATNTSSLAVAAIAAPLAHPERLLGLHFFNPAPAMKLVELVASAQTSPAALALARTLTEAAGKTVITAPDRPGFIVNRCARPFYGEALALLEEGRTAAEIEAAMIAAGYRIGPFGLIDLIGADINLAATESLSAAMQHNPRYHVFQTLRHQVESGALGRKTGKGFLLPAPILTPPPDADAIALRIEAALINEACWLLAEGGTTQEGIDTALKLGLNFPRGPFELLRQHGPEKIRATLADLEAKTPRPLRSRYLPAPRLA